MKVLVPGSGPIIIGQAAEFDYSGTQCCQALREAGHTVVLVNSNPATIMTDPETADAVYIEPLTVESVTAIIDKERPDAIMPGMGGQTGLNLAVGLHKAGIFDKYKVKILGTSLETIEDAEDRDRFREKMKSIGEPIPESGVTTDIETALELGEKLGYPNIIRPAFTLGGTGGGIAYNRKELEIIAGRGIVMSPTNQVLIEESVLGWQEYEFEVIRDCGNDAIIICSMENLDPMGVHTGESIVVAPALTLPEKDYQILRSAALRIVRSLKIVGGCNVQFAFNVETSEYVVIEVNPRVSRSSALASKATGFPIARLATLLALGHRLHELPNRVTGNTSAAFEPSLDYVVIKMPRWPFDKFPLADRSIGTQMKSTGETMAIGRSFEASLLKGWRSLGQGVGYPEKLDINDKELDRLLIEPSDRRLGAIWEAMNRGISEKEISEKSGYHRFFIARIKKLVELSQKLSKKIDNSTLALAKKNGFGDAHIAYLSGKDEDEIRKMRKKIGLIPGYLMVDTCAGEFQASTPYFYSAHDDESDKIKRGKSVLILGSGPIRIGQGIEFDYSTVHGVQAVRNLGLEAVVINNNPETVSTDFDASDRLYFEPLEKEEVLDIIDVEKPYGIILQLGGQTAVNLASDIAKYIKDNKLKTKILGTPVEKMDEAEDRRLCGKIMDEAGVKMPEWKSAISEKEVIDSAEELGYPVLVRPSFVLGGRAMEIIYDKEQLEDYLSREAHATEKKPALIDRFLEGAIELDVDLVSDGKKVIIGAIMEQIEMAGVHSGDSACVIPPQSLSKTQIRNVVDISEKVAKSFGIIGAANIQLAIKGEDIFLIEVNPRASRTMPFVSKTTGVPLARLAVRAMLGEKLPNFKSPLSVKDYSVKIPTFSWLKLPGVDTTLGPEMKSTGESMGTGKTFGEAYKRAMMGGNKPLPKEGTVYITVESKKQKDIVPFAKEIRKLGFNIFATKGTAAVLRRNNVKVKTAWRIYENKKPDILSLLRDRKVDLIINLPSGIIAAEDNAKMRRLAVEMGIPFITTLSGSEAALQALKTKKMSEPMPIKAVKQ